MKLKNDGKQQRLTSFNGPQIIPLDSHYLLDNIEHVDDDDEIDSLLKETAGGSISRTNGKVTRLGNADTTTTTTTTRAHFRQRRSTTVQRAFDVNSDDNNNINDKSDDTSRIRDYIRLQIGDKVFTTTRNYKIIVVLLAILISMVVLTNIIRYNHGLKNEHGNSNKSPHTPSLGGPRNSNHFVQNDNDDSWYTKCISAIATVNSNNNDNKKTYDDTTTTAIPRTSNVGISTVRSISKQNLVNKVGHYIHDPINNPYTSPYYASMAGNTTLQQVEQDKYHDKMDAYILRYGQWTPPKFSSTLVKPDFISTGNKTTTTILNRDVPTTQFPPNAWQSNADYVKELLVEAKSLVARVKEGIYEEYGYGISDITSTRKHDTILKERLELFKVHVDEWIPVHNGAAIDPNSYNRRNKEEDDTDNEHNIIRAVAYLNTDAWEGLIRKLLHGMMTNDVFYTVLVGHTNTYLGNNFQQSSIMEFNTIMEPIFDKLGMTLISRNMGMNATTTNSALGGSDIYGDADILWHVPDPRSDTTPNSRSKDVIKESDPMVNFLFRQAILSGERVPIILSPDSTMFLDEINHKVWMGNIQPGAQFCDDTYTRNGKIMVPSNKACQFVKCRSHPQNCDQHTSVCWVDRSDRIVNQKQDKNVGHQQEGYPSIQQQRLEGRKLCMLVLHAIDEALDRWTTQTDQNSVPLPDRMWHVSTTYNKVREHVRTTKSGLCGRFFRRIDPRICHIEMHAYTEWTPRVDPLKSRLKTLINSESRPVQDVQNVMLEVYTDVALLPPQWKIGDNDTDVHMIAIATDTKTLVSPNHGKELVKVQVNDEKKIYSNTDDDADKDNDISSENYGTDDENRVLLSVFEGNDDNRNLLTDSDISHKFWTVYNAPLGFCDGSAQSTCNRGGDNTCLLANYNHYRAGLIGHGQSGTLILSLPNVREGVILAKFDWLEPNGPRVRNYAPDFIFDYKVNGKKKTMNRQEFLKAGIDLTQDLRIHILMMDNEFVVADPNGQTVTIEMEVRSTTAGTSPLLLLTHLYYA